MLARLIAPALFLSSTAFADCLPDSAVVEAIQKVRDNPCHGWPECLNERLEEIERLLEQNQESMALHRMRQDLALAVNAQQRESTRSKLVDHYREHTDLEPQARRYLVARLARDEAGLREAVEHFPWARLDLIWRPLESDGEAMVDAEEAESLLEAFVSECPDASVLLAGEAEQLLISFRWPVLNEVRGQLLSIDPPAWERIDTKLIRAGLLRGDEGDPAERLLAELESASEDEHRDEADYWLYRARIHLQARDVDAALEANARAREIDLCKQLPPQLRIRPDRAGEWDADLFGDISEEVLACPTDFRTYQYWLLAAHQQPDLIKERPLARIRRAVEESMIGYAKLKLEEQLARIDICCTGHETEAAWAVLDRLHKNKLSQLDHAKALGTDRASMEFGLTLDAIDNAKLALRNDFPQQAERWWAKADTLFEEHRQTIKETPGMQWLLTYIDEARNEFHWIKARKEERHADAAVYALSARAEGASWVEMDEVLDSWEAGGGTKEGFERLLAVWDLDLPAKWRGWRRLGEPLEAFELADRQGQTWTLTDFEGKRTLLNLWAVWCGPCLLELPKVQELHERYRDDPEVQVVTVNLDSVEGVAREMMEREGYDFPVLMRSSDDTAFENVGIPRNWLIDGEGIRQWEQTGFTPKVADYWVEDIVSLWEQMGTSVQD